VRKPRFSAHSRVSRQVWPNAGMAGWPHSADRTQSPAAVSRKWEYSGMRPETFGNFDLECPELGSPEIDFKSQKPAISGLFLRYRPDIPGAPECLAGVEGIELTHSCSNRSPDATGSIWEFQQKLQSTLVRSLLKCRAFPILPSTSSKCLPKKGRWRRQRAAGQTNFVGSGISISNGTRA
jgi:hypothetical protein